MPWLETDQDLARARAEQPVRIETEHGVLFGIHTPADPEVSPAGRCAVLFTRPRSHRNRMWVEGARRLAARGFSAFRFDYRGAGDSEGESAFLNPNTPYREDAIAVLRHLREQLGERRFLVLGACFDARTALSAFRDQGDAIDGLVFFAAPLMELDTLLKADADRKDWKHLFRALGNRENWLSLSDPERWKYMAAVVGRVARKSVPAAEPATDTPLSAGFLEDFRALVGSQARALFVYGDADVEYLSFQAAERAVFAPLTPQQRARFEIEVWPGAVHGFLNVPLQRRSLERALEWFGALDSAPNGSAHPRRPGEGGAS